MKEHNLDGLTILVNKMIKSVYFQFRFYSPGGKIKALLWAYLFQMSFDHGISNKEPNLMEVMSISIYLSIYLYLSLYLQMIYIYMIYTAVM